MNRDKKVGLALAILLVSVVGAFFFRDDSHRSVNTPELKDAKRLDDEIRSRGNGPYVEAESGSRSRSDGTRRPGDSKRDTSAWDLPDFLKDEDRDVAQRNRVNDSRDPFAPQSDRRPWELSETDQGKSPSISFEDEPPPAVPIPIRHNDDWEIAGADSSPLRRGMDVSTATTVKNRTHVVAVGETLSSIAGKYLGSQARYLDIYEANKDQLKSPDALKVGMKLNIPDRQTESRPTTGSKSVKTERTNRETPAKPTTSGKSVSSGRVTERSSGSSDSTSSKKLKFKPSKAGPTIRRSVEADEQGQNKKLSQLAPQDLLEVDDGLLAELDPEPATKSDVTATKSLLPRVAQAESTDRSETSETPASTLRRE